MQLVKVISNPDEYPDEIDQELILVPDNATDKEIEDRSQLPAPMVDARIADLDADPRDFKAWRIYTG